MKRREFLAASCLAGSAPLNAKEADISKNNKEYYELRKYFIFNRSKQKMLNDFLRDAAIPAVNRIGIAPVGVFNVKYGQNNPTLTLYVLIPHKSLESFISMCSRLAADPEFQKAGSDFINAPISDPAYVRSENSLLTAFDEMPKIELPAKNSGIYELRTYESHSIKAAKKKIEMFNEGCEIQIFRDTGLSPVFFGETLAGTQMPNLTYMLAFKDMNARDRSWNTFIKSPEWNKLKVNPIYADTVSNITDIILTPASYSQI